MKIISSVSDLRNEVDGLMGCDAKPDDIAIVTDALQDDDHPAWGSDWTDYLAGKDLWEIVANSIRD